MTDTPLVHLSATEAAIARANGHIVYTQTQVLSTTDWNTKVTTPVTPPPVTPPSSGPSGLSPDPVAAGQKRALFDDYLKPGYDTALYWSPYDGTSHASQNGKFDASHCVVPGDSILHLQGKSDPSAGIANNEAGAGIQTQTHFPVGSTVQAAIRSDNVPGFTAIFLLMGANWPPEIDILEGGAVTAHWGAGNSSRQLQMPKGLDQTKWHVYKCVWTSTTITVFIDGAQVGSMVNPSPTSDVNGLQQPMFASLQYQTGDPSNPASGASGEMQVDWLCVDVPG
jgi:beta-glucanase (GH16 family)